MEKGRGCLIKFKVLHTNISTECEWVEERWHDIRILQLYQWAMRMIQEHKEKRTSDAGILRASAIPLVKVFSSCHFNAVVVICWSLLCQTNVLVYCGVAGDWWLISPQARHQSNGWSFGSPSSPTLLILNVERYTQQCGFIYPEWPLVQINFTRFVCPAQPVVKLAQNATGGKLVEIINRNEVSSLGLDWTLDSVQELGIQSWI